MAEEGQPLPLASPPDVAGAVAALRSFIDSVVPVVLDAKVEDLRSVQTEDILRAFAADASERVLLITKHADDEGTCPRMLLCPHRRLRSLDLYVGCSCIVGAGGLRSSE
jgi:hypothetical protein